MPTPARGAPPPISLAGRRCSIAPGLPASGQPPTNPGDHTHHATVTPRPDPLLDAEGTPVPLHSWVEQVVVDPPTGPCGAGCTGKAKFTDQGTTQLYILFTHDNELIALLPHLVRVLDTPSGH